MTGGQTAAGRARQRADTRVERADQVSVERRRDTAGLATRPRPRQGEACIGFADARRPGQTCLTRASAAALHLEGTT